MLWPTAPDPHYMKMLYRKRQEAFLEEADRKRMIQQEYLVRQALLDRVLYSVGALLVSVGESLSKRYAPTRPQECKVSQTQIKMNVLASSGWMEESSILGIPKGSDWFEPPANATLISVDHCEC